jgi:hypothetical protein
MNTAFRVIAALLLVGVLVAIGAGVYNAGVSQGLAQNVTAVASGAPAVAYGYYPGFVGHWGWGFGFFGIFFWILGIFLIFGLLRAAFGWGRGGHGYGRWGGHGPGGWNQPGSGDPRREMLDQWHRDAHRSDSGSDAASGTGKAPSGG